MKNLHEEAARTEKAAKLVATFRQLASVSGTTDPGAQAKLARQFPIQAWTTLAEAAGVHPPSAKTIALVIEELRRGP